MTINTATSPYYDDYNPNDKYHRILYRAGRAVQARELTQQQTILQNQIERFGSHIFKNGAMVIPGQITYDPNYLYVKLDALNPGGSAVGVDQFLAGEDEDTIIIQGESSEIKAEVVNVTAAENSDPDTFYVKILTADKNNESNNFWDGEDVNIVGNEPIKATVQGTLNESTPTFVSSGTGCATSIAAGIYFINGFFVIVDSQTVIINKYATAPSVRVGLKLEEIFVTSQDNIALTDNSQGSPNYAAPGADRYKSDLILETVEIDAVPPADFIELQRIHSGVVVNEIRVTEYSELERTFARRTYDESGDYTVSPFNLDIKEFYKETDSEDDYYEKYKDGKYDNAAVELMFPLLSAPDAEDHAKTLIAIGVEPGKAYVRGFERNKLATTWLPANKARTENTVNASAVSFNIGQYIYIKGMYQIPDISDYPKLYFWDAVGTGTDGNFTPTIDHRIGSANVRSIELANKNTSVEDYIYRLFLFDIEMVTDELYTDVLWISSESAEVSASAFHCITSLGSVDDTYIHDDYGNIVFEPTKRKLLFTLPHSYIKSLIPVGPIETTYTVQKIFKDLVASSNTITANVTAGEEIFEAWAGNNYILMDQDEVDETLSGISVTAVGGTGTNTATITGLTDGHSYTLLAPVEILHAEKRSKSLPLNAQDPLADPSLVPQGSNNLEQSDGVKLNVVYMSASLSVDALDTDPKVTDRYFFDNGQRESYYDYAKIVLRPGAAPPTGRLLVDYDHYSHSGTGDYFSVDSYSDEYEDIPTFNSEDGLLFLSDVLDFRPAVDATGGTFGTTAINLPLVNNSMRTDYDHYLNRRDKLYIDFAGTFHIIEGIPEVVAAPPQSPDDGMVLYEIFMEAYTSNPSLVAPVLKDNKRYTMKMIGDLDQRIGTLEYYGSLSLLEQATSQMQIQDGDGLDRFKNGFIVEPFTSHAIGDSGSAEYKCSIDPINGIMRPTFYSESIQLNFDEASSDHVVRTGPLITLPYTSTAFINQSLATSHENVNPFAVRLFEGEVTFNPDSDNWYDTNYTGTLIVNNDAHYEALQFMANNGKGLNGVTWEDFESQWTSSSSSSTYTTVSREGQAGITHDDGYLQGTYKTITTTTDTQKRTGTNVTNYSTTIDKNMGDRTIGMNYIPYMRSIAVLVKVTKMKPNTRVYPFFDDIDVSEFCEEAQKLSIVSRSVPGASFVDKNYSEEKIFGQTSGAWATLVFDNDTDELTIVNFNNGPFIDSETIEGESIVNGGSGLTAVLAASNAHTVPTEFITDSAGQIALIFTIPNSEDQKFRTGERVFKLTDQVNG